MNNLVEIPAECLRWCPRHFEFYVMGDKKKLLGVAGGAIEYTGIRIGILRIPFDTIVIVSPEEYTKAVVQHLKSVIDYEISHISKEKESVQHFMFHEGGIFALIADGDVIAIKADPQPWLDEYTLEVTGE